MEAQMEIILPLGIRLEIPSVKLRPSCFFFFCFVFNYFVLFIYLFIYLFYSYLHTMFGSFLPSSLTPSLTLPLSPLPPGYLAETILPLSLILLKREYKQ
jgi:hypothetical protein